MLRKHGVRFGQYNIFMQLLLKPAPTRLRLVLWSLQNGFDVFPEAPPPGLVTVPAIEGVPEGYYEKAGYRLAGARAIRIDMLERLADLTRGMDSRAGFEATPDMLSITGMTLEQFADLMQGLGYKAERGEREKVKQAPTPEVEKTETAAATDKEPAEDAKAAPQEEAKAEPETAESTEGKAAEATETAPDTQPPEPAAGEADPEAEADADSAPEIEVYYTFTWAPKRRPPVHKRRDKAPAKQGGKPRRGKDKGPKVASARPPRKEKPIDPDNPFAALMALKEKG